MRENIFRLRLRGIRNNKWARQNILYQLYRSVFCISEKKPYANQHHIECDQRND